MKESAPQLNSEFEQKILSWYKEIVENLRVRGFKVTPAEAVFLRQTTRDVFIENEKNYGRGNMDGNSTFAEIIERFFWHYYGINTREYSGSIKWEYNKEAMNDLFKYIQEKLRKDRELI